MNLNDIDQHFKSITLPKVPIRLDQCTVVTDAEKFVESHITVLRNNSGDKRFLPFWDRLNKFKKLMELPEPPIK